VTKLCGLPRDDAFALLQRADGRVKVAVVMDRRRCTANEAERLLDDANGRLREVVD